MQGLGFRVYKVSLRDIGFRVTIRVSVMLLATV